MLVLEMEGGTTSQGLQAASGTGIPALQPQTSSGPWPVGNQSAQQVGAGKPAKLHLYLDPLPMAGVTT